MLSLLLLLVSTLAYDSANCDCHMMLGFVDGSEMICDALNICSASDVDLEIMDMLPVYGLSILNAPGIQLTNVVPDDELLYNGFQNQQLCDLCKKAIEMGEKELPQIEDKLEQVCNHLNKTIKVALCKEAIRTIVEKIEKSDPEADCEKLKVCNNSTANVKVTSDMGCTLCKDVVKKIEDALPNIEPKLEKLCDKVPSIVKKLICEKAVEKLVQTLENLDPTGTCQKVHLCNATAPGIIVGQEKWHKTAPRFDACATCQKVWDFVQKFDDQIKSGLDMLCKKLKSTVKDAACEFAVNYVTSWIDSHNSQTACADVHLCNSTNTRIFS